MKSNATNFMVNVLILAILLLPVVSYAEVKEILSEGTYNMGDGETPSVAESRALLQAKRTALEQAGTYVESYSKVKNFQLTEDEIQVLASGVMEVNVLEKKRTIVGDGFNFWVKIKAVVSMDKMEEMARRVKEKSVIEDYKRLQKNYETLERDIGLLKRELSNSKSEKGKIQIEAKIADNENLFRTIELVETAQKMDFNNEYDDALEVLNYAITLNQTYAKAYRIRGGIYHFYKNQDDMAIKDYTRAIELDQSDSVNYNNRGTFYMRKGQYDRAIEDHTKAIALDQNPWLNYYNRGFCYFMMAQYAMAIIDFNKAIVLNADFDPSYGSRGKAYFRKGQYDDAIEDYTTAISMNPEGRYFSDRGEAYYKKGQNGKAIEDYNKAISIDPKAYAYYGRGLSYYSNKNVDRASSDFKKACDMGKKDGCDMLKKIQKKK